MIDFVKSTDSVYREIRLLRAAVNNSSKVSGKRLMFSLFLPAVLITITLFRLMLRLRTFSTSSSTESWA